MSDNYSKLGASSSKAGVHKALADAGLASQNSYFAGIIPDFCGDENYRAFLHCDGAGTKCIVAHLLAKATGSNHWFSSLPQDAVVMNLDDAVCLGPVQDLVLSNLIARNARLVSDSALSSLLSGYQTFNNTLQALDINIRLAGGETADCGDSVRTLLVDAVLAGRIQLSKLISTDSIVPGDVIVGFSNTGQATYETSPNSGIGSNGLTLARHAIISSQSVSESPEVYDPAIDAAARYRGRFAVTDFVESLGMTAGEALLSPTRTYAPVLLDIYKIVGSDVHGVIHNTGGGQTKVLRFGKNNLYIKDNLFPAPALFKLIQEAGSIPWKEMYEVFNMGHRMEIYLPESRAKEAIAAANRYNIEAQIVGRVERGQEGKNALSLTSEYGSFSFSIG